MAFMQLTSPLSRRNSIRPQHISRPELGIHRSQTGNNFVSQPWEKFRKSDADLKSVKNKKVRKFYENQV